MVLASVCARFARQRFGPGVRVSLTRLRGGLEADGISRVLVRKRGKPAGTFVAKPFADSAARELNVYQTLKKTSQSHLAPALLGWRAMGSKDEEGYLFLEWVRPERRWPWAHLDSSSLVLAQLAALHRSDPAPFQIPLSGSWDYERELVESAAATVKAYERALFAGVRPGARPMLPALQRILNALPRIRRELMTFTGTTFLHGDVHSGNVVLKSAAVLLLDWGRARIGSPLEDVSSWIHSLALWEPEARRKHDTLL